MIPTKGKEVVQVVINVSKKFILLATFCERVDGIDMNLPEEMAAMAGRNSLEKLEGVGVWGVGGAHPLGEMKSRWSTARLFAAIQNQK